MEEVGDRAHSCATVEMVEHARTGQFPTWGHARAGQGYIALESLVESGAIQSLAIRLMRVVSFWDTHWITGVQARMSPCLPLWAHGT